MFLAELVVLFGVTWLSFVLIFVIALKKPFGLDRFEDVCRLAVYLTVVIFIFIGVFKFVLF